jgi:serine/threonine-protein kinase HipA
MGRPTLTRRLDLWMNGDFVGRWSVSRSSEELHYESEWLASAQARPLSLSLPFTPGNRPHRGEAVRAYFENLLPDVRDIRERLARRFSAESAEAFDLLAQIGRDCVGAIQLVPEGTSPGDVRRISGQPLSDDEVEREIVNATTATRGLGQFADEQPLRISLAGAQEKTALLRHRGRWMRPTGATPTTHIFKLPLGLVGHLKLDMQGSVENEWLCAQILRAFGLPVAACEIERFGGQVALVVQRFDRVRSTDGRWIVRLPQEDMCQVTATPPSRKYESEGGPGIDAILDLLRGSSNRDEDRLTFLKANLLFWLLCAPDGHAKNFSVFLEPGGSFRMTPLYDVLSAYPVLGFGGSHVSPYKIKLAMAVRSANAHWKVREIQRRHWTALARRHGMVDELRSAADRIIAETSGALATVRAGLPDDFPPHVSEPILRGLELGVERFAAMPSA